MKSSHARQDFMQITIELFFTTNINGVFTATQLTTSLVSTKNRKKILENGKFFQSGKVGTMLHCIGKSSMEFSVLYFQMDIGSATALQM